MKASLITYFSNFNSLSAADLSAFSALFRKQELKKKCFFVTAGEVCKFEGFVISGLLKVYHLDSNGFEQIIYFAQENQWIVDFESFALESSSNLYIEAIEDSELLVISNADKILAFQNIPSIERLFRLMMQKRHADLQRRVIDMLSKTALQRYLEFKEKNPQLYQRLTNVQLAAYLGISHEFLSKIRRKSRV